jgi:hypothetical protein
MSESSLVWNYLKPKLEEVKRSIWVRIESPITSGIPDLHANLADGKIFWIELKYKKKWEAGLGTSAIQRNWMRRWIEHGGNAFLLARIGDDIVLVPGNLLDNSDCEETWRTRAAYHGVVGGRNALSFDAHAMCRIMLTGCK